MSERDRILSYEYGRRSNSGIKLKNLKYQIPGKENKRMLIELMFCVLLIPIVMAGISIALIFYAIIDALNGWMVFCGLMVIAGFISVVHRIIERIIKR